MRASGAGKRTHPHRRQRLVGHRPGSGPANGCQDSPRLYGRFNNQTRIDAGNMFDDVLKHVRYMELLIFQSGRQIETEGKVCTVGPFHAQPVTCPRQPRQQVRLTKTVEVDNQIKLAGPQVTDESPDVSKRLERRTIAHPKPVDRDHFVYVRTEFGNRCRTASSGQRQSGSVKTALQACKSGKQQDNVADPGETDCQDVGDPGKRRHGTMIWRGSSFGGSGATEANQSRYCRLLGRPLEREWPVTSRKSINSGTSETRRASWAGP